MNQTAFINPAILSWSRQRAGLSEAKVAKSLTVHLERVREWEVGQSLPTFNQAQNGPLLHISLLVFFSSRFRRRIIFLSPICVLGRVFFLTNPA